MELTYILHANANYKFREAKSQLNVFWVSVVKNGCGFLAHEALKSALSQEWI